jgi:ubiquinone/menaquinone biosynthesis C-methylase UbiE
MPADQDNSKDRQWQLSNKAAELYEQYPGRYILGPWAPLLVKAAQVASGDRVVDVACGTGLVARVAASIVGPAGRVIGIDLNPGMIAVARSLPAPTGASIEWLERSALDLGLDDASFDVVLCQQGLQFFPDKLAALQEMRRILAPNSRLALSVWTSFGIYNSAVVKALSEFLDTDTAQRFAASRQAPNPQELEHLTRDAGFLAIKVHIAGLDIHLPRLDQFVLDHLAATPIAGSIAVASSEARNKIGSSVMQQLQRYADGDGVTFPEESYVLTANTA